MEFDMERTPDCSLQFLAVDAFELNFTGLKGWIVSFGKNMSSVIHFRDVRERICKRQCISIHYNGMPAGAWQYQALKG